MICVYYTSTDTGREDISNTDNKDFLHIDSMGFLRLVRMIRGRTVKKRTAAINTAIRFLLAGRVRQMSESAFVSNLSYESRPFGEAGIIGDPYGRRAPRLRAGRGGSDRPPAGANTRTGLVCISFSLAGDGKTKLRYSPVCAPVHEASRLAVPGECCGLTLILAFSDRCGNCELTFSATGSVSSQFPRRLRT